MTTPKPVTLDRTTKVNVGILVTLLASTGGGAAYLTTMNTNVLGVTKSLGEVKQAIDRITVQLQHDGKSLAVLQALVQTLDRRVADLEKSK